MEVKDGLIVALFLVPHFKLLSSFGGHDFGHVVVDGWDGIHVLLMVWDIELEREVPLSQFRESKGFGKRSQGHLEETERIDETDLVVLDLQQLAPVSDLLDFLIVRMVLVHHKVPVIPLKIVCKDIDGARVLLGQSVEPFEKISQAVFSLETDGSRILFGFGHNEIGHVLFLGLHGFNVKEHVQGGWFLFVVALVITPLVGPQGLKTSGSAQFGGRTPFLLLFPFAFLFLFFLFLRREGFLNETLVGLSVDVLLAGGTVKVTASMTLDVFESLFQFETPLASAFVEADTALMDLSGFSFVGFASVGFETCVSEKVPSTIMASLSGFQTARVGVVEIGAVLLETAAAFQLDLASMFSRLIVRFETVAAHMTMAEEPLESGDDIIMPFLVEQDELFVWGGWSKTHDVEGTVGIHQDDLVVKEGRRLAELGQLFIAARTEWHIGFVMEEQGVFFL